MKFIVTLLAVFTMVLLAPHATPAPSSSSKAVTAETEIIVEAYVDGPSTLHLTLEGIYWTNGNNAKPGRWHKQDLPTYINGAEWKPIWGKPKEERGPDQSALYPAALGTVDVDYQLLAVTQERGAEGREKRGAITAKSKGAEFTVLIPDPESEPRWYRFVLRRR